MTWTFDLNALSTSDKDKVRMYCGDTDQSDQLMSDEGIELALDDEPNVRAAAALVCEWLAADFARHADSEVGDLSIAYSQRFEQYTKKAAQLRSRAATSAAPVGGGISIDRMDIADEDTDRVTPPFRIGMMDNPEIGRSVSDRTLD